MEDEVVLGVSHWLGVLSQWVGSDRGGRISIVGDDVSTNFGQNTFFRNIDTYPRDIL
jgi:hypothetical protein